MILFLKRHLNGFAPAWTDDLDKLKKLSHEHVYKCTVTRPRNLKHHRKFFAMLSLVMDNLPEELEDRFKTTDDLLFEMKLQTGCYEKHSTIGGKEIIRVKSIKFEKMAQDEFEEFYDACLVVVAKYILPGISKEEIINNLIEFWTDESRNDSSNWKGM